eukprot:g6530.t1
MNVIAKSVGILLFCVLGVRSQESNSTNETTTTAPSPAPEKIPVETPAEAPTAAPPENRTTVIFPGIHTERHGRVEVVTVSQWTLIHKGNLTVHPEDVASIFTIPMDYRMHARYNVTFTIPTASPECTPNTTLWFTPAVYFKDLCMERSWRGGCTMPGKHGFQSVEELREQVVSSIEDCFVYIPMGRAKCLGEEMASRICSKKETQNAQNTKRQEMIKSHSFVNSIKGDFCYTDREYWIAFKTICPNTTYIEIEVSVKDLNLFEKWTCRGFDHFMLAQHGMKAFLTSKLFWAIIVPIGYFAFLVGLAMICCNLFQCGALARKSSLLNVDFEGMFEQIETDISTKKSKKKHKKKGHRRETGGPVIRT